MKAMLSMMLLGAMLTTATALNDVVTTTTTTTTSTTLTTESGMAPDSPPAEVNPKPQRIEASLDSALPITPDEEVEEDSRLTQEAQSRGERSEFPHPKQIRAKLQEYGIEGTIPAFLLRAKDPDHVPPHIYAAELMEEICSLKKTLGLECTSDRAISQTIMACNSGDLAADQDRQDEDAHLNREDEARGKSFPHPGAIVKELGSAGLPTPRFLLPPSDPQHVPPHMHAIRLLVEKYELEARALRPDASDTAGLLSKIKSLELANKWSKILVDSNVC